jgi:hypothetical protein
MRAEDRSCGRPAELEGKYGLRKDPETGKWLVFLTNNFALPALTITKLYRMRWRSKAFFGTTKNTVKSHYVLVAIIKKRLELSASLYESLQILSLTMFERLPVKLATFAPTTDLGRVSFP